MPLSAADVAFNEHHQLSVPCRYSVAATSANAPLPTLLEFEGYASAFNVLIDAWIPTRILPGAFRKTIACDADRVTLLWSHDPQDLIGRPLELREDRVGLYVRGQILTTIQRGHDVAQLMRNGILREMSIGFEPVTGQTVRNETTGTEERHLSEIRLIEISPCAMGANPGAQITKVHRRMGGGQADAGRDDDLRQNDLRLRELELAVLAARTSRLTQDDYEDCARELQLMLLRAQLPGGLDGTPAELGSAGATSRQLMAALHRLR
jgi:HK97 family phage prohead protease